MAREIRARLNGAPQVRSDGYGVDHDITITWINALDAEVEAVHLPCPIPLVRYAELSGLTTQARVTLYRELIKEFYGGSVPSPNIPQAPTGLSDLALWDAYADEQEAYDTQLAANIAELNGYVSEIVTWIEGLPAYDGYPFPFVLQQAS